MESVQESRLRRRVERILLFVSFFSLRGRCGGFWTLEAGGGHVGVV